MMLIGHGKKSAVASAAFLFIGGAALAHHGFTGRYDASRPIWIEGTVESSAFAPPHPVIAVRVDGAARPPADLALPTELAGPLAARPEDTGQRVEVEFPPVSTFYQMGSQIRVGERVAIIALRNCNAPHQLRSQWVRAAAGTVIERGGRMSGQVNGC
ncbi:MAG: DUF6152 family protein [Bosea sp. (in: a-proteobacteria)]